MLLGDVVPCAYLRAFQPLEAFPPDEQARWERYIVGGGMLRRPRPNYRQWMSGRRLGVLAASESDGADIRIDKGAYYVCPWRTRLRVLASLLSFREGAVRGERRVRGRPGGSPRLQGVGQDPPTGSEGRLVHHAEPLARPRQVVRAVRRRRAATGGARQ